MGMYDYIVYSCKCPVCGDIVTRFQSKDGDRMLSKLKPYKVKNFYTSCDICNTWIKFETIKKDKYKMIEPDMTLVEHLTKTEMLKLITHDNDFIRQYCQYKLMSLIKGE